MGKAAFVHLSDGVSRLQIYVRKADVKAVNNGSGKLIEDESAGWELFGLFDHGDFIGLEGYLFITKTGELSVHVQSLQFLSKALLPLPDKMHGIHDPEIRQRQRYADLIAGSLKLEREEGELTPREVFDRRSAIIREMRRFLEDHNYVEVETPMLTSKATGAAAKPFETHHNALDITLYARIAPELYLKRLLVGGFEKVYELNRNFRNEGIDRIHNPEFTMLEFYWAYADVNQMMEFCEQLMRTTVFKVLGRTSVRYGEQELDFSKPFVRLTMKEAVAQYWPTFWQQLSNERFAIDWLSDPYQINRLVVFLDLMEKEIAKKTGADPLTRVEWQTDVAKDVRETQKDQIWKESAQQVASSGGSSGATPLESGQALAELFERIAEHHLIGPTFITDFPKPVSPLSKASPNDPSIAERFELFITGMESANGFSELNDPKEQYDRFNDQVKQRERGDEEAMVMDEDYIRALSYGMPPAAGIGIGIDRFVMLLTNQQSIRDVILFPHMRPERKRDVSEEEEGE
jgi:lysyl-tRNA synthetase class 2